MRVPLFDRNQGNRAAAEAELERAGAECDRARLKLEARFAPVFAAYEQEYDRASRYREGILPRAKQAYELYLARYRQMAAPYPQVLMAQRAYFEAEASYLDALERVWVSSVLHHRHALVGGAFARDARRRRAATHADRPDGPE